MVKGDFKNRCRLTVFFFCFTVMLTVCVNTSPAAEVSPPAGTEQLFSPSVAQLFLDMAYEEANSENYRQALAFLNAMMNLDVRSNCPVSDTINIACMDTREDRSGTVLELLNSYMDKTIDMEVIRKAVQYLMDRLSSREEREVLLVKLLKQAGEKNLVLNSELSTLLGLLIAEKADIETAQAYFMQAYKNNKYNRLAFTKLSELAAGQVSAAMRIEHLRLNLGENPMDMNTAMAFAKTAEQMQIYQTAADAYRYCADLFGYLHPGQNLPPEIYLPWVIESYNTARNRHKCLQIAQLVRKSGQFDLIVESFAGKAAAKNGDSTQASEILRAAEDKAIAEHKSIAADSGDKQLQTSLALAWFYCFVSEDAVGALDWANKALSLKSDSADAAAILAYALVMNSQDDLAKPMIADKYQQNQAAALAMAKIQIKEGKQDEAAETLKSAIKLNPASLEAETARNILTQQKREYVPSNDPDIILAALTNSIGPEVVPAFNSPDKMISIQLNMRGNKFFYGNMLNDSALSITNNSSEPLVISDDGLLKGNIVIDANVGGDIQKKIPNLVQFRIRPASPIKPGQNIMVPLRLAVGELRRILLVYPQASLDIELTVFVDPPSSGDFRTDGRTSVIKPIKASLKRPGLELTATYLRNRFESQLTGQQGQKIKTIQLCAGLMAEQHIMANKDPLYKFMYADWIPEMLKSAILYGLRDKEWVVKVNTLASMLLVPLDYEMTNTAAENLSDANWPVRFMTIYLLSKTTQGNFDKVLDWTAQYDSSSFVRDMAVALGGKADISKKDTGKPSEPLSP